MNIFKREIRQELKPFLFWALGIPYLFLEALSSLSAWAKPKVVL